MNSPKAPAMILIAGMTVINLFIFTVFILPIGGEFMDIAKAIPLDAMAPEIVGKALDTTYMTARVIAEFQLK